jgi:hypothetical protein
MPVDRVACQAGDTAWAQFRFGVIGHLLAAPPSAWDLGADLDGLAA